MKQPIFTGSGTAIVTPFTNDSVDYPALGRLLDFQLEGGADAIIVCGTTGEAAAMSYEERIRTIEAVVRHVDGRVPVIAGTGSNNTENAIAMSRDASGAGVDALLVVTPFYNKATPKGLIRHYTAVADAVEKPRDPLPRAFPDRGEMYGGDLRRPGGASQHRGRKGGGRRPGAGAENP